MDQTLAPLFCLLYFGLINSQTNKIIVQNNGSDLWDSLRENNNRIDFTIGLPDYGFNNYMIINGWIWDLKLTSNALHEYEVKVISFDPNSTDVRGYGISQLNNDSLFSNQTFSCGFILFGEKPDIVTVGVINSESNNRDVFFANFRLNSQIETKGTTGLSSAQLYETKNKFRLFEQISAQIILKVDFVSSDFRPQVAFLSTIEESEEEHIIFIETIVVNEKYQSRYKIYKWKGLLEVIVNDSQFPNSVLLAANKYYIKGVFPVELKGNNQIKHKGFILLIEMCTHKDLPCTGHISYYYCFVEKTDSKPTDKGKPCHKSQLNFLFDSNGPAISVTEPKPKSADLWLLSFLIILIIFSFIVWIFLFNSMKGVGSQPEKSDSSDSSEPSHRTT